MTKFHKIIDDLENIEVKIEDEENAIITLISLPISCGKFKDTLLYGNKYTITLDEVQTTVRSKEFLKVKDLKIDGRGEGLNVSIGRSEHIGMSNQRGLASQS